MNAVLLAPAASENIAEEMLQKDIAGAISTIEQLGARAAYLQEPCAQILFRTAELLRLAILKR